MKKRFLCLALVLVMLVGTIPFSAITAFAADPTSAQSNDVETVTVTTFDELRTALEANGEAKVVLENDISIRDPELNIYVFYYDSGTPTEEIPSNANIYRSLTYSFNEADFEQWVANLFDIDVLGVKTLDLNGHNIFAYLRGIEYKYVGSRGGIYTDSIDAIYNATLFDISRGATLNLDDTSEGTPGNIFFDGYMYDTFWTSSADYAWEWEYRKQLTRDIFSVSGTLNVFNGIIEAGRSKEQWIVDGVLDNDQWRFEKYINDGTIANTVGVTYDNRVVNRYDGYARQQIWGSAVTVQSGGTFNAFGGIYYGRGEGYYNDHDPKDDAYNYGTDRGESMGSWAQDYRRDEVICLSDDDANVNVYGGYFEGKGGANVFGGDVTGVHVFDGEFKNSKVDKVRCVDADATNDYVFAGIVVAQFETPMVITGSYGEIGLKEDNYYEWSESGLGIKNAFVNGEARTDGEIVPVKLDDGTASIKFEWNGLSENFEKAGCKLYPVVQYYLDTTKGLHPYEIVDNSAIITTPLSYDGQKSTFKFDLYLLMPNGKQVNIGSHTVVVSVEKEVIERVSISLDTLVGGTIPADYEGKVNTTGVSITEEAWYEYNGGSLKKMNDSDKFVAGNQYVYGVTFAFDSGYRFNPFTTVNINGIAARKSGDYFHWTSAVMTAKTALTAEAVNNTLTVEYGGQVRLEVNAKGDGLEYVWRNTGGGAGAPSIGVNGHDNILLTCANAGNFTYTCTVSDKYGNKKVIEFIVMVKAKVQTPQDVYTPARPIPVGTGIEGVEDTNNVFVNKGGSITLKATYKFSDDPNDIYHGGKTPVDGELSYEWVLYILDGSGLKTVVLSTTDTLVIDGNLHETYNTNNICEISILLSITNTATIGGEKLTQSNLGGCTVKVVEGDATGNVKGNISSGQNARTFSMRSGGDLEGTIVYLMKEDKIVYATEANAQGYYTFTNVLYGSYNVKVDKEGYDEYNEPVEVNAAEVDHDITIILHVCFADEGMAMHVPATQPTCSDVTDGTLGNIEYRGCIACGKFYDMEGNLIADSANDPGSLNEMGVPYKAIIYPVHDYCGEAQEGGDADRYLRHRADNCLEETTYWHYCIYCRKSAGDDPSAVDKYYVGSASNQTHIFTKQIAEDYYHYDFHKLGVDGKENCKQKIWYYHACEYCGAKGNTVWESDTYGAHDYSDLREYQPEIHTATELKGAVAQHHFCHICNTYLSGSLETTLEALTSTAPTHSYTNEYGYKGADGHANTCSCGAKNTVVGHTSAGPATETTDEVCSDCGYVITVSAGHSHNYKNQNHDLNNHWNECACGEKKDVAAHSGGTATCTAKAKCSACGAEYGALAAHAFVEGKCVCGETDPNYTPETTAPGTEAPETTAPGTDTPGTEAPGTEAPGTEAPGTEAPGTEAPGTAAPGTETPGTGAPGTEAPGTAAPGTEAPGTGAPGTEAPGTGAPGTEAPGTDEPQTPDDNDGLGIGAVIGIIIAVVVILGGGFAVYWFVIKKKP